MNTVNSANKMRGAEARVGIIGGGICGLTTAIALRQRGIKATVFEATPEIRAVGAGLWVAPNALEIFRRMGLYDDILARGCALQESAIMTDKGKILQSFAPQELTKEGYPLLAVHRAELQSVLLEKLRTFGDDALQTGKTFLKAHSEADGSITAAFDGGASERFDILVGADGIRSRVRAQFFGETAYRYSGQTSWRGVVDLRLPRPARGVEIWTLSRGVRFGYSPISDNLVYFYATACAPSGENNIGDGALERLRALFANAPEEVRTVLGAASEKRIIGADIWDFDPIRSWHSGRVVLAGDAAHATTPNLGQGACQAIEDGFVLAESLADEALSLEEAFARYERLRMEKARFVVKTSRSIGAITNWGGVKAQLRNIALARAPRFLSLRQMKSLFAVRY